MEMKDTTYLQHTSLIKFMAALGYETVGIDCCKGFVTKEPTIQDLYNNKFLSLQDAVNLHNGHRELTPHREVRVPYRKPASIVYQEAFDTKLIDHCYIQRKASSFHLQKQQVQLTEKGREYVLEGKCGSKYQWLVDDLKEVGNA